MNAKKEKIIKMSKILDAFLKIGAILMVMATATFIVSIIIAPSLDLTSFSLDGLVAKTQFNGNISDFRSIMVTFILNSAVIAAILYVASFIFKGISRGNSPFEKKNAEKIKIISYLMVALGVLVPLLQFLIVYIFIGGIYTSVAINLENIVFAAVFFCLALIFEYGAELQQQSDETL